MISKKNDALECCIDCSKVKRVLRAMEPENSFQNLADTFKAIGDCTRTKILFALGKEELCVGDIACLADISSSAASHQLRVLRHLKLVKFRREGKITYYALDDDHIKNLMIEGFKHVAHQNKRGK